MTRPRPLRALLPVVAGALVVTLLGACATGDGASSPTSRPLPELRGSTWDLASYAAADGTQVPAVSEPAVGTLTFLADGRVSGSTGCNRFTGTYEQAGARVSVTAGAMTRMACLGPAGDQDSAVIAALSKVTTAALMRDNLVLRDAAGVDLLVYAPGLTSLSGTSWTATGINNGKGAVVTDATTPAVTARFEDDNRLSGTAGCNTYTSTWTTTGADGLTLGPVAATEMACQADVMATEQLYLAALAQVDAYQLEGDRLTLRDADGAAQVTFIRASS